MFDRQKILMSHTYQCGQQSEKGGVFKKERENTQEVPEVVKTTELLVQTTVPLAATSVFSTPQW